jgi:hypothetical protein
MSYVVMTLGLQGTIIFCNKYLLRFRFNSLFNQVFLNTFLGSVSFECRNLLALPEINNITLEL